MMEPGTRNTEHGYKALNAWEAEQLRWRTSNLLFGFARSLRAKLKNNEDWQRGLLKEQSAECGTSPGTMFQVPGPMFPDREAQHG